MWVGSELKPPDANAAAVATAVDDAFLAEAADFNQASELFTGVSHDGESGFGFTSVASRSPLLQLPDRKSVV